MNAFPQIFDYFCKSCTAQKMNFSIKNFFSKCDQIRKKQCFSIYG